jgi:hypothetical protein
VIFRRGFWLLALGLAGLVAAGAAAQGTLETPLSIRVKMADGRTVSESLRAWDGDGFEGSAGRVLWADLVAADVNRTLRKVIDDRDPKQQLLLGRALLSTADGGRMGDSALRQAVRKDGSLQQAADKARAEGEELRRVAAERRLRAVLPGGGKDSAVPLWPIATDAQRAEDLEEMRNFTKGALRSVNARWTPLETEYWVIYSDLNRGETAELGKRMDRMYLKVAEMFALPAGLNLFHGKGVCVVSGEESRFKAIEMAAFNQVVPPGCIGLCHMIGPKVIVNAWRSPDDDQFMATLVHEATHGIMHRYGTPARLPIWAEEGYAEFVAARSFESSPVDRGRRPQGIGFIRSGQSTLPFFQGDAASGSWPGPNAEGYALGYLAICLMIDQRGNAFGEWVKDVKTGMPWEAALKAHFRCDAAGLAAIVEDWYRRNP